MTQGADGSFYGTTPAGGIFGGLGTIFKITTNGSLTTLHSFNGADGAFPYAGLVLASDGYFYGATFEGAAGNDGAIFRMTAAGALTNIYFFTGSNDGAFPAASLIQGSDGKLYGTTYEGGVNGNGTIFQITTNGVLTTLAQFDGYNGSTPQAPLIQAADTTFYGTAGAGGVGYDGTPASGDRPDFCSVPVPLSAADHHPTDKPGGVGGRGRDIGSPRLGQRTTVLSMAVRRNKSFGWWRYCGLADRLARH